MKLFLYNLKRLEHEIMFLCVDTYSFHQGMSKQKSFFRNTIKNYGKEITKVDKRNLYNEENIILRMIDPDDKSVKSLSKLYIKNSLKEINEDEIKLRSKVKEKVGIKSHTHHDIDNWIQEYFNEDNDTNIKKLSEYRDLFAHRLDSIEKLMTELKLRVYSSKELMAMLDVVKIVLEKYKNKIKGIIVYMTSEKPIINGFKYESLDKIQYIFEKNNHK